MSDWLTRDTAQAARGGTELLREGLSKYTSVDERGLNVILCNTDMKKVRYNRKNILWQHNNYSDESVVGMRDRSYMRSIDATVYVSHWQYEKFRYLFQVPTDNAYVIKNSIEPIEFQQRSTGDKIRLIYTSAPFRGLEILLDAFSILGRDDVELDVYSSPLMYGSAYTESVQGQFDGLLERAANTHGVNYHGYAPNEDIRQALMRAHIFAYPSIFEETACLAMIEAGAAGCRLVTTDLGALYETGSEWATMIEMQADEKSLVQNYAAALENAVDKYWDGQDILKRQSEFFNEFYSWERRAPEWERLFDRIS